MQVSIKQNYPHDCVILPHQNLSYKRIQRLTLELLGLDARAAMAASNRLSLGPLLLPLPELPLSQEDDCLGAGLEAARDAGLGERDLWGLTDLQACQDQCLIAKRSRRHNQAGLSSVQIPKPFPSKNHKILLCASTWNSAQSSAAIIDIW